MSSKPSCNQSLPPVVRTYEQALPTEFFRFVKEVGIFGSHLLLTLDRLSEMAQSLNINPSRSVSLTRSGGLIKVCGHSDAKKKKMHINFSVSSHSAKLFGSSSIRFSEFCGSAKSESLMSGRKIMNRCYTTPFISAIHEWSTGATISDGNRISTRHCLTDHKFVMWPQR